MGAPVCNVPTGPTISDQPDLSKFPPIPQATDLGSLIVAVNAIRQILMQLTGQTPIGGDNNARQFGLSGGATSQVRSGGGGAGRGNSRTPANRFVEIRPLRVTEKVKIYNPDDHDQYITVLRTNSVTWLDRLTGQTIGWSR